MEEQKIEIKKNWKAFWIIFDAIVFGGYFLCFFIFFFSPNEIVRFYEGLNDTNYTALFVSALFDYWYITLTCLVILLMRMLFWSRYFQSKWKLWIIRIVTILMLLAFNPVTAFIHGIVPEDNSLASRRSYFEGFCQRIKSRLDVEELRNWIDGLESSVFDGKVYYIDNWFPDDKILPVPVPEEINCLGENIRYLILYKEDQMRCVNIVWSTRLARRGLLIGPKEMPISECNDDWEYKHKLEEGVYVWYELQ